LGEEISLPQLFINLKTLKIEARKDSDTSSSNEIRINRLMSTDGFASVLKDIEVRKDFTSEQRKKIEAFRQRILDYSYPVQILDGHDYVTVAEIFRRVNKQGKALVTAEVELAKLIPYWPGVSKCFRDFIRQRREEKFYADLPFYMKCLAFVATDWPAIEYFSSQVVSEAEQVVTSRKKIADCKYRPEQLNKHWELVKKSVIELQALLIDSNIDRTELITTRNALVPIVYAIAKDKGHKLNKGLLVKWLIYAMDGGHYSRQTESVLRKDSQYLIDKKLPIAKGFAKMYRQMTRNKKELASLVFDASDFEDIAAKNPAMLFIYLSLRYNTATDFGSKPAPIEEIAESEVHHIFPAAYMLESEETEKYRKRSKLSRMELRNQVNDVANLTFISKGMNIKVGKTLPATYFGLYTTPEIRAAHCIPENPELWKPENFEKFCDERRKLLAKAMNSYIKNLG
jgi:hypothetical protein